MLVERRYPLTKNTLERMMDLRLTAVSDDDIVFDLLRFIEQYIDEFGGQDGTFRTSRCSRDVAQTVLETFHDQMMMKLTEAEIKIPDGSRDDQSYSGDYFYRALPEDIYVTVDSCETAQKFGYVLQHK
ncbi:hypothetical protein Tco_0681527 [Tanacetum coccineum]|uniref:Uncharacterized protein n=1 Tax=Tanacetum coccineum TaxID=301880 RepID=A0ABQ4XPX3_9ASTR